MKLKTTKSFLNKNCCRNIINLPYCSAQYLLRYSSAFSYCAGVYGWSCDNYKITAISKKGETLQSVIISTGYRPAGNKANSLTVDYKTLDKYESAARKYLELTRDDWKKQEKKINKILNAFILEILADNGEYIGE